MLCEGVGAAVRRAAPTLSIELVPCPEGSLERGLEAAPWTVLAVGLDPATGRIVDPCGGSDDLANGRLAPTPGLRTRTLGLLTAVAAARLAAEWRLVAGASALEVLARSAGAAAAAQGAPLRHELGALLLAEAPAAGLAVLRESGLEAAMIRGTRPHAHALVEAARPELVARFAAWLLDTHAPRFLARLRLPRPLLRELEARIAYRAPERAIAPREASLERAANRLGSRARVLEVIALRRREWELDGPPDPEGPARLDRLEELLRTPRGPELAWSGHDVMRRSGLPAGRDVGRALAFLRAKIQQDPGENTPERLQRWLDEWLAARGPGNGGPG